MAMDLDKDYTVDGNVFKAGKGVDTTYYGVDKDGKQVKLDAADSIKESQQAAKDAENFGGHTSGVPTTDDPLEPTSGTPTRPDGLGNEDTVVGDPVPKEEKGTK